MIKLKVGILVLSATLMLGACGEKFRPRLSSASQTSADVDANANTGGVVAAPGQTAVDIDQSFANEFDYITNNPDGMAILKGWIKAFSVVKKYHQQGNGIAVTLEAHIATSCGIITKVDGIIEESQLRAGNIVRLSTKDFFSVQLQCTDASCNEMAAAITYSEDGSATMGAFAGVKLNPAHSSTTVLQLEARNVDISGFSEFQNIIDYLQSPTCNPAGVNNGTGSTFELDPTGVSPTPVTGNPTVNELESFFSL